ncbi:MAG TPA: FKBP-type peptidyl-prolyl cis-trans isomerase [Lacisediminihabitans sp.]|nr:FKBP-type peptidyl-prolyl cis-trans isomerase [Lacisediminihabitans sp.]HXD61616.1 FKBP-type peptidyl-prolyl cis-trans isomerase [Lacisediminihabitans sp.]
MSKLLSAVAVAGLLVSLVGCSAGGGASGCTPTAAGDASAKVSVSGKLGTEPKVKIPKKLTSKTTERTVAIEGKGRVAQTDSAVDIDYAVYNTTSGKKIDATSYGAKGTSLTLDKANLLPGLYKAIHCSTPGSRIVAVIPPADAFGKQGSSGLGIAATDSIVFVIDVLKTEAPVKVLKKADGKAQEPKAGFPTVKLAKNGEPTITMPKTDPPKDLQIEVLKKGAGKTVKDGATVTINYTGALWATGKTFDSSWTRGAPATFATTGVVSGFGKAMIGQTVGSQVVAVIPPSEGYGADGNQADPNVPDEISGTDTMVFVIDILAVH